MIFFTADTHFGHRAQVERRIAWSSGRTAIWTPEAHDTLIIERWNAAVGANDEVYHLGDFSFAGKARTGDIVRQLRGRIKLVPGNHDSDSTLRFLASKGVEILLPLVRLKSLPSLSRGTLCHYPLLTWPSAHYGAWHLHGHSHGNLRASSNTRVDVGIDVFPQLLSMNELEIVMRDRAYEPVDHHGGGQEE